MFAPEMLSSFEEPAKMAMSMFDSQQWALGIGVAYAAAAMGFKKLKVSAKIPAKYMDWLVLGTAMALMTGAGTLAGQGWQDPLMMGATMGLTALGAESTLGKLAGKLLK